MTSATSAAPAAGRLGRLWPLACLLPGAWMLIARPPVPVDETRYLTVAWEMWLRGDFLVPYLNGLPYSHKPPMLFWLMHAGWAAFGVNEWWPRLLGPLCALLATTLTVRLARVLWPDDAAPVRTAPWLLVGTLGWIAFSQMLMFDMLLTCCVLLALTGAWRASRSGRVADFALVAAGIGLGILAKGPVVLLHVLAPALLAPWWSPDVRARPLRWYARLALAVVAGLLVAGAWALPAAEAGGPKYAAAILWDQTAGRMRDSFAHARPWYSYLMFLPLMLLPWVAWPRLWRSLRGVTAADSGMRFLMAWAGLVTVGLSLLSAKQVHYAVPELVPFALLMARLVTARADRGPPARLALATVAVALAAATVLFQLRGAGFDLRPVAARVAELRQSGAPVYVYARYQGQLGFLGRLEDRLPVVSHARLGAWAARHPGAYLVNFDPESPAGAPLELDRRFPYRLATMAIWRAPGGARP